MKKIVFICTAALILSCGSTKTPAESQKQAETTIEKKQTIEIPKTVVDSTDTNGVEIVEQPKIPFPPAPPEESKNPEENIHLRWQNILQNNVSEDGEVNYLNLKANTTELQLYIDSLSKNPPLESWTKENKLAYWINAYNALTIDLILYNYPIKSIKNIKDPWDQRLWRFDGKWITLNEIEHKILRKMNEPRIHFAIVCASISCPKLQNTAFTADNLDTQLTKVTKAFLADTDKNTITANNLELSKIFKWFKKDFEKKGKLVDFLNKYSEVEISPKAEKSFKDYNWDLND